MAANLLVVGLDGSRFPKQSFFDHAGNCSDGRRLEERTYWELYVEQVLQARKESRCQKGMSAQFEETVENPDFFFFQQLLPNLDDLPLYKISGSNVRLCRGGSWKCSP